MRVITPPIAEPVPLELLVQSLDLNTDDEINLIAHYNATARSVWERMTQHYPMRQTHECYFRCWDHCLTLDSYPFNSIEAITYYDENDDEQELTDYILDTTGNITKIYPNIQPSLSVNEWPRITITYTVGADSFNEVPFQIRTGLMLLAQHYYYNRQNADNGNLKEIPYGLSFLADSYKLGGIT